MDMPFPVPQPAEDGTSPFAYLQHILTMPDAERRPAVNINTVGGVPNSSWYTNRHYRSPMTRASLRRGPDTTPGPALQSSWRVDEIQDGELPRVIVRDTTGRQFRILFDAAAYPELATGAAMVGSRLLHALGYNVPHYWLRTIHRDHLRAGGDTSITEAEVDRLLARAPQYPDGHYRVLVSRIPDVERRIGPFSFHESRVDDGNDIFPHEDRRELRGLRLAAAWIHHSMIRERYTLDVGVRENGRRFVRHYLTDLHLTLGSAGASPKRQWAGHEHLFEFDRVLERAFTLGLSGGDWVETVTPYWPAVGNFDADDFSPAAWRPKWPNAAFERATPADHFWAAKKIRHFSRPDVEAVVEAAEYSSSVTTNFIVDALLQRRNAIGRAYLGFGGGLGRFRVEGAHLRFRDLLTYYGYASDSLQRRITWHVFDNWDNEVERQLNRFATNRERIPIPLSRAAFLEARIQSTRNGDQAETRVYLRRRFPNSAYLPPMSMPYEVVGVERQGSINTD